MSGPLNRPKMPEMKVEDLLGRGPDGDMVKAISRVTREHRRNLFWWRVRGTFAAVSVYAAIGVFIIGLATVFSWWN